MARRGRFTGVASVVVSSSPAPKVSLLTLGCSRNEVDSEELAGRLASSGWRVGTEDDADADVVLVNTCGFIAEAKKDSVDALLAAGDSGAKVVAVGCMAERYGKELAASLPEADAVLGFDDYPDIDARLQAVLAGQALPARTPADRRKLLPVTPVQRQQVDPRAPGHGVVDLSPLPEGVGPASGPRTVRRRLRNSPVAPLKLASGCDRRCSFCAIPSFRGAFVSRPPHQVLAEARELAAAGARELFLVSENSTSYGKDLGEPDLLAQVLPQLAAVEGVARVRVSYLQPAELRPATLAAIANTAGVAPYFDLSFQHSSPGVLRRMRRFGSTERFLELLARIRQLSPEAGIRSNFIVGFPGETQAEYDELAGFLSQAGLDAIGVFGYSDEDGTEAETLPGKLDEPEIAARVAELAELTEQLTEQRAAERIGQRVQVLVESVTEDGAEGIAAHQASEVDGGVILPADGWAAGDLVTARVYANAGVDLLAAPLRPSEGLRS